MTQRLLSKHFLNPINKNLFVPKKSPFYQHQLKEHLSDTKTAY